MKPNLNDASSQTTAIDPPALSVPSTSSHHHTPAPNHCGDAGARAEVLEPPHDLLRGRFFQTSPGICPKHRAVGRETVRVLHHID